MSNWDNKLIHFIRETGRWDKEKDMFAFTAFSISLLKELTGAYLALQVVLEDDYTAKIKHALPDYFNELVLNPDPIRSFLEDHHYNIVYWEQMPYYNNVFEEVLTALSSAVIIPVEEPGSTSVILLGWSETQVCHTAFKEFVETAAVRLKSILWQTHTQRQLQHNITRFTAILQQMPQAVIYIDDDSYTGWVNQQAAALLELPEPGDQPPNILAAAMAQLRGKASNKEEITTEAGKLFTIPGHTIQHWIWQFDGERPRRYRVFTEPVNQPGLNGRLWVFDEQL